MKEKITQPTTLLLYITLLLININSFAFVPKDTLRGLKTEKKLKKTEELNKIPKPTQNALLKVKSEFTQDFIMKNFPVSNQENENRALAKSTCDEITKSGNYIGALDPKNLAMLPIGIKKNIGNIEYMLGISNAKFTPEYTELTAFVRIIIPQHDTIGKPKELFFGANNIKLSHKGGLVGDTNLVLLGDCPIKINGDNSLLVLKGGMDMQTGEIANKTYVTIDCNGFKELGITADVEFSRSIIEPVDLNNKEIPNARVKGTFSTIVSNWNDILVDISLPKFQLTSFKGTYFELNKAVIDLSDLRNSENVIWPENYANDYLVPGNENLWRGLYVKSLLITLPEEFKFSSSKERVTFHATDLLIDRMGISGSFTGKDILSIDKGSAAGWAFSVSDIYLKFRANALVAGGFGGAIVLPVTDKSKKCPSDAQAEIGYTAIINPIDNLYSLKAEVNNNLCFQVFNATAKIDKGSYIELKVKDGKFLPKAFLNGMLAIKGSKPSTADTETGSSKEFIPQAVVTNTPTETTQDKTANNTANTPETDKKEIAAFEGIIFQDLQLQTVTPVFTTKYFGYKNEAENDPKSSKVVNFPITIHEIAITADDISATLIIDLSVNLMKDQFSGRTKFDIVGKFAENEGIQKWKFDHLKFEKVKIEADLGGAKFKGSISIMDDDPIYGKGFKGSVAAQFSGGIAVEANAIFGKKDDFRYWYVDAMVDGLNIPAGAITFKGFAGGAYYRMKKNGFSNRFAASGSNYIPDIDSGLGVKAMIKFAGTGTHNAFWGGAGFEIAFNNSFGINRISIYGEGHVMQPFELPGGDELKNALKTVAENESKIEKAALEALKTSELSKAAEKLYPNNVKQSMGINAFAAIEYDFRAKTLHGSFDLYINTPGGFIKGRASENRAGWAVLHFGPDKWYIRMGTPTDRLGLKMGIGSIAVEAGGYFMMGDDIPASPPPPDIVAQILRLPPNALDYMRSENSSTLGSGKGFAFGSDFSMKTGDMSFLIFYASFEAGLGFDIMVKDYGESQCKGSGQIGINGWYASGQSYAYLQGKLGIQVKVLKKRRKITIIEGGAAVLMQAKLPNPAWIRGYLGGHYDVLGGLIKGNFRFKIELGSECEFINSTPLDGLKTIADIIPSEGSKEVSVFTVPQVGFNMPIEKNFVIDDDEGGKKTYRLKLEEYTIKKDGVPIIGTLSWNDTKDLVSFNAFEILPQNSNLILTAKISFQEIVNGSWVTITENGQVVTETETRNFTTGTAPNNIPESNIAYCYPVFDQEHVYQNESKQAYVVLKQGQSYLFDLKPGQSQKAFYKTKDNTATGNISYDSGNKRVNIELPVLKNTKTYSLSLMTLETKTNTDNNLTQNYVKQELATDTDVEIKSNKLNQVVIGGEGTEMLKYNFNTSQYNSFKEKMADKKPKQTLVEIIYMDVHALQSLNESTEPFDEIELIGNEKTLNKPLVTTEAVLDDKYYLNEIYPLIYKEYPLENEIKLNRDTALLGIPPVKGVETMTWYQDYILNNPNSFMLKEYLPYRYNLPFYYKKDFIDLRYKIVNKYKNSSNQAMITKYNYIINGEFPYIKEGTYKIKLNYTLPGGQAGASTGSIFTFNKLN